MSCTSPHRFPGLARQSICPWPKTATDQKEESMQSASFLFVWLLAFIMPWEGMFTIPGFATFAKLLGIGAVAFGAAAVFASGRPRFPIVLIWPTLFVAWCCLSISWAADPEKAMEHSQTYVLLLTFAWLVCQFTDNPKRLKARCGPWSWV